MKNLIYSICIIAVVSFSSCSQKIYNSTANVQQLINTDQFTFLAERANPTNFDVINVMNSFPGAGSQRFLTLDYGYVITLKDKELKVDLPYFGRMYTPNFDSTKNNFNFTSKDFTLNKTQNKKGDWEYKMVTNDQPSQITINISVFSNGKSYANLISNDRQSISYDGYIMKNKEITK
ncbi:DUF4251 domain-containing protein [Halpernia frigidisoli]|uniref:DUF4251 domain-containing protein n=1 Tax=Halpernia frigidisoli TaxID=1125876 RepID=A0A1I3I0I1_9FLAO|nr:DUF4251 domain-containing protein [Halpernia frigidisoli]SFI41525.1 protein of unknown function [Halpernia frigidisoli]